MNKTNTRHHLLKSAIVTAFLTISTHAQALPTSSFATQSQLASGRWVKIAIPEDGIYELTEQELSAMGFADASRVKVFGHGGHMINEVLNSSFVDDLQAVPVLRTNGKLCFYACGPVGMRYDTSSETFMRTINAYSTQGYYFLTDDDSKPTAQLATSQFFPEQVNTVHTSSFDYVYHEVDQFSFGMSGKNLMGENITSGGTFDIKLPGNTGYVVRTRIDAGAKVLSGKASLKATFNHDGTPINLTLTKADVSSGESYYYGECSTTSTIITDMPITQGQLNLSFASSGGLISHARLDNYIFTYTRHNSMQDCIDGQARMTLGEIDGNDLVAIEMAQPSTVVWNIDDPLHPVAYPLTDSEQGSVFAPHTVQPSSWIAFSPKNNLKKIAGYEAIGNQNLHGMPVPHMLIITNHVFIEQAQRIAQLHDITDGIEVAIVDQEEIFNEFSSGTPDAMAYRLLCKMLYDRDPSKFKYLLLLGGGSYDNRGLATKKDNRIITYQTNNSTSESTSYTTDDFFGFLDDDSGASLSGCKVRIGIARIPSATAQEAASDIDKLYKYVLMPDYGPWRNNMFFSAEYKDEDKPDLHQSQAELLSVIFEQDINSAYSIDKSYINMFPKAVNEEILSEHSRTATEAHRHFIDAMQRGQYFATYVGHAGPRGFTNSRLWTSQDVSANSYEHMPIFTTACCEVARFDSDMRGIAESMFHKPDGGAIALLTSTRQVVATSNDNLNRAWIKNMFNWEQTKKFRTLGEINMLAKQSMSSTNHHKYVLFGDPAMRVSYPVALFKVISVNGTDVTNPSASVSAQPLHNVNVTAHVLKSDRSGIDTEFNGDATLTIYDMSRFFRKADDTYANYVVDMYYPRDILAQVNGRVENGIFHGTAVLPRHCRAVGDLGRITVYAHKDDSDFMVNGDFNNLTIQEYSNDGTSDNTAPVITSMYLNNEESFDNGTTVAPASTLYVHATDNLAINNQSGGMGSSMRLVLDGGKKSFYTVGSHAQVSEQGKALDLAFPLDGLTPGTHSLAITIHDVAGNAATRTISFVVGDTHNLTISVDEVPATTHATIQASKQLTANTDIRVTDALGKLVWKTSATSFPVVWDLKDTYGRRVPGGLYHVSGAIDDNGTHGGTNTADVIVITPQRNPIKR